MPSLRERVFVPYRNSALGVVRGSAVYALGTMAGRAIGLLLLPIYTRLLPPASLGHVEVLYSLGSAMTTVVLLGVDVALLRMYAAEGQAAVRRVLIGTWLAIALPTASLVALIAIAMAPELSALLFGNGDLTLAVGAVGAVVVGQVLQVVALTVMRAENRVWGYVVLSTGTSLLYGLFAIAFLIWWRTDATAVVAAWAAALIVAAFIGLTHLRTLIAPAASIQKGVSLLRLGLPLMPGLAMALVAEFVHRAILVASGGPHEVGLLAVAVRVCAITTIAVSSFQLAWQPRAFALGDGKAALDSAVVTGHRIVGLVAILATAGAAVAPELLILVAGPSYVSAATTLGFCLIGSLASALLMVATIIRVMERRSREVGFATIIGVAAGIALNALTSPMLGSVGTAAGIAMGQCVSSALLCAQRPWVMSMSAMLGLAWTTLAILFLTGASESPLALRLAVPLASTAVLYKTNWRSLA